MILAGDIGGTNARFACYESRERKRLMDFATRDYRSGGDLLTSALAALGRPSVSACCLAVAGPVLDGEARLTNADIAFSLDGVARRVGTRRVALVNDMVGFGSAVATLPDSRFELLGGEAGHGAKGVIAAGTGLGMTVVVNGQCLASEGGHARVAPAGAFERELLAVTEAETEGGVVAWEHYLSGRGIVTLYRAVATVWGVQPAALAAEEITRRGLSGARPRVPYDARDLGGAACHRSRGLGDDGVDVRRRIPWRQCRTRGRGSAARAPVSSPFPGSRLARGLSRSYADLSSDRPAARSRWRSRHRRAHDFGVSVSARQRQQGTLGNEGKHRHRWRGVQRQTRV